MDLYQVVLPSGRGVRIRILTPTENDQSLLNAAKLVGAPDAGGGDAAANATGVALNVLRTRECIKKMLHSITKGTVKSVEELNKPETVWEKLDGQKLELDGPLSFDKLFSARDDAILTKLYNQYHEITKAEAEAIVGKAQPVSVD